MEAGRSNDQQEEVLEAWAPAAKPPPPRAQEEVLKQEVVVVDQQTFEERADGGCGEEGFRHGG